MIALRLIAIAAGALLALPGMAAEAPPAAPKPRIAPPPRISVTRGLTETIDPLTLAAAWRALRDGDLDTATRLYRSLEQRDVRNADVQFGLAALALARGDAEEAHRRYVAVLRADPQQAFARTALQAYFPTDDAATAAMQLRSHTTHHATPLAWQALGALYARSASWSQARQAYAEAYRLDAHHPDAAYNLAVSLDHLGEATNASRHYEQAAELARHRAAGFDPARARERARQLGEARP